MAFEAEYSIWMNKHLSSRSGERLRRLKEGHAYGEKLFLTNAWYPAVGNFDDLHPEYEVYDYRDGLRFIDHAFIRYPHRVAWESDSFGTHLKKIGRKEYDDGIDRQNYLMLDKWKVFRFSVDQLQEQPRKCQQFILLVLGELYGKNTVRPRLPLKQREIVRMAVNRREPITVADVRLLLNIGDRHARILLKELVGLRMLVPASGSQRITSYRPGPFAGDAFD